jgi:glutathione reductase (NADPH)
MSEYDYDLFVIGAGSGGTRASRMAAAMGARVAVAEDYRVGGTCVIRGCIPKKLLAYAAHFSEDFEDARGFGWSVPEAHFSWPELIRNKNTEIQRLSSIYVDMITRAGATILRGRVTLEDAHTLRIHENAHEHALERAHDGATGQGGDKAASRTVTARHILIATGGRPTLPAFPGVEHAITSNDAFELPELPRRVVIVGGGYIAVEFAGIFHGLGSKVTVIHRGNQILRGFDADIRNHLHDELAKKGIRILLDTEVQAIAANVRGDAAGPPGLAVRLKSTPAAASLHADAVMFATGRHANTANMGLAEAGVRLDENGGVVVDEYCRSSVDNIYAVGDVTHRVALTPVAIREGAAVAQTLFGGNPTPVDHVNIPSAVFSQPPIGTVGLSEEAALEKFGQAEIYKTAFRPLKATLSGRHERTMMKLVVEPVSQRVVGAHMVGGDAPEIIQGIAIAVKAGLTKQQFDATVGIHPTAAEEFVTLRDKRLVTR